MWIAFSGCRNGEVSRGTLDDVTSGLGLARRIAGRVLVGDCPTGIDRNVWGWSRNRDLAIQVFRADWETHGKAAGPIRNRAMVAEADMLIAFWDGASRGTLSAIREAVKAGIPVRVYPL